jgi:hypothetical protein
LQERTDLLAHDISRDSVALPALETGDFMELLLYLCNVRFHCRLYCAGNYKYGMTTGGVMLVMSFVRKCKPFPQVAVEE